MYFFKCTKKSFPRMSIEICFYNFRAIFYHKIKLDKDSNVQMISSISSYHLALIDARQKNCNKNKCLGPQKTISNFHTFQRITTLNYYSVHYRFSFIFKWFLSCHLHISSMLDPALKCHSNLDARIYAACAKSPASKNDDPSPTCSSLCV